MASLYEINKSMLECVDMETGEVIDEEKLNGLEMEKEEKLENIALWIKNLKAEAEMVKAEKERLDKRIKACKNKAEQLTKLLADNLDGAKFKTSKVNITYRKSDRVEVTDIEVIPQEFLKLEVTVNKTELKKALKSGFEFDGAELVTTNNIQVN